MAGKPVTEEQRARILELFERGEYVTKIAEILEEEHGGPHYSWIAKFLREQFGPRGTENRPRPPQYNKTDDAAVAPVILEAFERLKTLEAVAEELGHSTKLVSRVLKGAGVVVLDKGRPRVSAPEVYCRVCGELIPAKKCFYGKGGVVVPARTCGKPECKAALALGEVAPEPPVPRQEVRRDTGGWTAESKENFYKRQELETLLLAERLDVDMIQLRKVLPVDQLGEYHARFELVTDPRGSARPGDQSSVWGKLSRVPVYLRLVARREGHAAIQLLLDKGETTFDRFMEKFFSDKDHAIAVSQSFRPLIAWRCACSDQTTWTLDTVLDLPEELGFHGLCPTCGACALSVERMKR